MKPKHLERLRCSQAERSEVCVVRRLAEGGRTGGFVLAFSDELLLLHAVHDFHLDGCRVVRLDDVEKVHAGDFEKALERVMEGEKPRPIRVAGITCVQIENPYTDLWLRRDEPCPALGPEPEPEAP